MRTRFITFTRMLWALTLSVVLACIGFALWQVPLGWALDELNEQPAPLGLVGMTEGQTLRVSVAYVKGFDPQPDPPGCLMKIGFADPDGTTIGDPHLVELRPGASRSFDHVAIGDGSVRHYVRPVVSEVTPRTDCPAVVTGELLDREGVSAIIIYDSQPVVPEVFLTK